MKITTWNVNGIRAALKKDFKKSIAELNPDVLCLQEVKAREEQLDQNDLEIEGYQRIWNAAQRPGYSGVATYIRKDLIIKNVQLGIGREDFDNEGRTISFEIDGFTLYNIYFPNGQRGMDRVEFKLEFYKLLLEKCTEIHKNGGFVVITGDFNTAHTEIDLANPKENSKNSGFLPEEREWISIYLQNNFKDAYRKLYPDRVEYTWWTYRFNARPRNIGWRLDYYLVTDKFMERVKDVVIHSNVQGSDHCPVSLIIQ